MILIPLLSLGIFILCLVGALISFQYFTHFQSMVQMDRVHIVDQRQRAQTALGYLVAFSFAALLALTGILYPAFSGFIPQPLLPVATEPNVPDAQTTLLPGETPGFSPTQNPPAATTEPPPEVAPTRILPTALIGNTGGAGANIRSIPGLGGVIIEVLTDGTRVILLDELQEVDGFDWQKIEMPDTREGWIVTQYLIPEK